VNSWHAQTYLEIASSSLFITISVRKTANWGPHISGSSEHA
jgi:hypothetical protein